MQWRGLAHAASAEVANNNRQFRTYCGEVFAVATVPPSSVVTCLFCIYEEDHYG